MLFKGSFDLITAFSHKISLHYGGWKDHPNGENMQLEGVKNDVKALLDHLGCKAPPMYFFLFPAASFDLNVTRPTR